MKMKAIAGTAFLLNVFLYGSYYSVAKGVLGRVDPIVFTFFTMMTLVPPAIFIIACSWRQMTREAVKSGFLLGSCLCLGLFTLSVALKYNSATGTAFFPALNGLLAALFTWIFLRQAIAKATWLAGLVSVTGAVLLMLNASMGGLRGALIAFIGGLFCTFYIFLADREQKEPVADWPLFGVELLTMAVWANLIALLFGDWQMVHIEMPGDLMIVLYIGLGTIFLPTLITVSLQKHLSPVTVSFISILEPILGAGVAYLYLHEVLPFAGYLGGGLVVAGALIHTWGSVEQPGSKRLVRRELFQAGRRVEGSLLGTLVFPLLCCGVGVFIVCKIGGFPPPAWRELFRLGPQLPALVGRGHGTEVLLLVAQAFSWLIAWVALVIIGFLTTYRALDRLVQAPQVEEPVRAMVPMEMPEETGKVELNVRSLRQLGYTPYTATTRKRKQDVLGVQQRRMARRLRLAQGHNGLGELETAEETELEPRMATTGDLSARANQEQYRDASGNSWVWWEDISSREVRER